MKNPTHSFIKMSISGLLLFGVFGLTSAFAAELNSSNITTTYGCSPSDSFCDLSSQGITSIASGTFIGFSNLSDLYLYGNNITSLQKGSLYGLDNLSSLELSNNQITTIDIGAFDGAESLYSLFLGSNQLTGIKANTFHNLNNLNELGLSFNKISTIESGAFLGLSTLQNLYLDGNKLSHITKNDFNGLTSLSSLALEYNLISEIEKGSFDAFHLYGISLYNNKLIHLPEGIFSNLVSNPSINIENNCLIQNLLDTTTIQMITDYSYGGYPTQSTSCYVDLVNNNTSAEFISKGYLAGGANALESSPSYVVGSKTLYLADYLDTTTPFILQSTGLQDKIELQLPTNTRIRYNTSSYGLVYSPIKKNNTSISSGENSLFIASFAGSLSGLYLTDTNDISQTLATIRIPVLGISSGSQVSILNSQDNGNTRRLYTKTSTISLGGKSYVKFSTDRLGDFAVSTGNWGMSINNNDATTDSLDVTLSIHLPTSAQYIRFSNDGSNWGSWQNFSSTMSSLLSVGVGTKTIYSELDYDGDQIADIDLSDTIVYNGTETLEYYTTPIGTISQLFPSPGLAQTIATILNLNTYDEVTPADLSSITTLTAQSKNIKNLSGINLLKNLTSLDLEGNGITGISYGDFAKLKKLSVLMLGNNQISSIESGDFLGLENLSVLHLGNNKITSIESGDFINTPKLTQLYLLTNQISSIESGDFYGIPQLVYLSLATNKITSIESLDFSGLTGLQNLRLNENQISSIEKKDFMLLKNLQELRIQSNKIHSIEAGAFDGFSHMEAINLAYNRLGRLPNNLFSSMLSGVEIDITSNCIIENELSTSNLNKILGFYSSIPTQLSNCYVDVPDSNASAITSEFTNKGYSGGGSGALETAPSYLVGTTPIKVTSSAGKVLVPVIMQSEDTTNKIESQIPLGVVIETDTGVAFTGIIGTPKFRETTDATTIPNVVSVASFGVEDQSIHFKNQGGDAVAVTVRIPAPGLTIGSTATIYYSEDNGSTWTLHTNTTIVSINGQPYAEFTTTHFTDFAISAGTGSFTINNDAATTTNQNVTLTIDAPGATQMRFSNDGSSWNTWEAYATSKSRTLSAGAGAKTVYAEFDTNNDSVTDASTSDIILYSPSIGGTTQGDISLVISSGSSSCSYGTTINLGRQTINSSFGAMMFSGDFLTASGSSTWSCTDFAGSPAGWNLTIQSSDLINESNNIISAFNVKISHDMPTLIAGDCIVGGTGVVDQGIETSHVLLGKQSSPQRSICRISTNNVKLKVDVPANQAPGTYAGTLTLTIPSFN